MKLSGISVGAFAAAVLITGIWLSAGVNAGSSTGDPAPRFTLKSISGKSVSLSQILKANPQGKPGKAIVLDFWATWCPPCREEAPALQRLHERYSSKGVTVVGVAMDEGGAQVVKAFAKENRLKYTIAVDPTGSVARKYAVRSIPATFILDGQGRIRYKHVGFSPDVEKQIVQEIESLLR